MSSLSKQKQIFGLIGWLVVSFAASAVGAVATIQAKSFYSQLIQPHWAPLSGVFGPVWTILYTLMGIAAWLTWRRGGFGAHRAALTLFLVQLVFNALWSLASGGTVICRHRRAVVPDYSYAYFILANTPAGRSVVDPLFIVGKFCGRTELCHLATQPGHLGLVV